MIDFGIGNCSNENAVACRVLLITFLEHNIILLSRVVTSSVNKHKSEVLSSTYAVFLIT
jgi:hypothetical protein